MCAHRAMCASTCASLHMCAASVTCMCRSAVSTAVCVHVCTCPWPCVYELVGLVHVYVQVSTCVRVWGAPSWGRCICRMLVLGSSGPSFSRPALSSQAPHDPWKETDVPLWHLQPPARLEPPLLPCPHILFSPHWLCLSSPASAVPCPSLCVYGEPRPTLEGRILSSPHTVP